MKRFFIVLIFFIGIGLTLFLAYLNNSRLVNPKTVAFYKELKKSLKVHGFKDGLLIVSTIRFKLDNYFLVKFGYAVPNSQHMKGEALDFLVFDVNSDGKSDGKDVDVVYKILDAEIIKDKGGLGTYKNQGFLTKQMVHIDCRGYRARWNR